MFVDFWRRVLRIFEDAPAFQQRRREMLGLYRGHSLEEHRHGPGTHLIIGDQTRGKSLDQELDFCLRQLLTFALFFDERGDVHDLFHS
jgi:hypothetical protein